MGTESKIANWYRGKSIFITGATGFMGKVLVEKLLRSCPDIGPIYILVREKKPMTASDRVQKMLGSELFNNVCNEQTKDARNKLFGIFGDASQLGLGISEKDKKILKDNVSVVFHVAATIRFDEPLKVALAMNVGGTKELLELCRGMVNLSAVVHVSTAYANCSYSIVEERIYPASTNPEEMMACGRCLDTEALDLITPRLLSKHPNTYTYTKALAENLVANYSEYLPIVIVRPSIVSASWLEPEPGWVDNFNGPTAIIVGVGKGLLKCIYGHREMVADIIPVDVCINVFIAAAWERGTRKNKTCESNLTVYNCTSGPFNPLKWSDFVDKMMPHTMTYTMSSSFSYPKISMTNSKLIWKLSTFFYQVFPATVADILVWISRGKPKFRFYQSQLSKVVTMLEFFTTHEWRFEGCNVERLRNNLSTVDQRIFNFDLTQLKWDDYLATYFLGIRRNVLRENDETIVAAQKWLATLAFVAKTTRFGILIGLIYALIRYYTRNMKKLLR